MRDDVQVNLDPFSWKEFPHVGFRQEMEVLVAFWAFDPECTPSWLQRAEVQLSSFAGFQKIIKRKNDKEKNPDGLVNNLPKKSHQKKLKQKLLVLLGFYIVPYVTWDEKLASFLLQTFVLL